MPPGGTIANIGVHGMPVELPMQEMWIQNVTLTMGLVDTVSIPILLKMVASAAWPGEDGHALLHVRPDGGGVRRSPTPTTRLKAVITRAA